MNYEKSWTHPGQGAPGLDQDLPIISEEEVLRYLQKNLDEQEEIDEIFGKIKISRSVINFTRIPSKTNEPQN